VSLGICIWTFAPLNFEVLEITQLTCPGTMREARLPFP
jgi:hypothetical protein